MTQQEIEQAWERCKPYIVYFNAEPKVHHPLLKDLDALRREMSIQAAVIQKMADEMIESMKGKLIGKGNDDFVITTAEELIEDYRREVEKGGE